MALEQQPGADQETARRGRRRAGPGEPGDSLLRYLLTAAALFLVVGAVALFVIQAAQGGRAGQPGPVAQPTSPPVQAAGPPVAPAESAPPPAPPARPGEGPLRVSSRVIEPSYTVAPGDTLGSIASQFGTSVEALQSINNLADRNVLSVGQRLVIPNQP